MQEPLQSSELLAFARTVEAQSLSRAARELGVPRATLSRRLARIEARLGVRLIHRTTRRLSLTDAGETLHRHAQIVLEALREAEASVRRNDEAIRGELRISAPGAFATFSEMLADFAARHPDLRVETHFTSEHVDLRAQGYDVVLRAGVTIDPGLVGRVLSRSRLRLVASPAYLQARGAPRTPKELEAHRCLMGYARGEVKESYWPLRRGGRIRVESAFSANDPHVLKVAALRGLGIALLPSMLIHEELAAGLLLPVLTEEIGVDSQFMVLHVDRELVSPAVRAFVQAVSEWAKTSPWIQPDAKSAPPKLRPQTRVKGKGKRR